jgi:TolB-like protein/class 3 adenylate cyclase/Flp pilus assembly protein TadD
MSATEQRQLAAIVFTDMVGYSAIAQRDEALALEMLEEHRRILREILTRFNGIEIKTIGDAFLLQFRSALEAVQCAIEIQRTLAKRNHDVTPARRIDLKIGIHIGEVVSRDGDIYGSGVNIASRIEPLARAGGICVSMDVERQIRSALEIKFEKFTPAQLKNIELPMDVFRLVLPWETGAETQPKATTVWKRWALPVLAAVVIVGLCFGWRFLAGSIQIDNLGDSAPHTATATAPATAAAALKSVAVLAFVNLSDEKGSEYFSDGISEELLTMLQKIPGLRVVARTSAFSFKGKDATAQEIGQKLGVAHLIEGSVRKAGNSVRIAARLTRTDNAEQLWSENYTRDLKDVFAVQTELAETIVGRLRGQLTSGAVDPVIQAQVQAAEKGGTRNVEAHQSYLQGRFYYDRYSEKGAELALAAYQRAVELDPNFALAWAGLAQAHLWYCSFSSEAGRKGFEDHLARAREAVAKALQLEPNLPEALLPRSRIQLFDNDHEGAAGTLRTALALAPANPALLDAAANLSLARGDMDRSIALYRQALELDPLNPAARLFLAYNLAFNGQYAEARAEFPRVVELNPAIPWAHAGLGLCYALEGKFEDAVTAAQDDAGEWARLVTVAIAYWGQKRIPEADAALAKLTEGFADTAAYQIAEAHAYRGEKDQAFEWLERARRQRDAGLVGMRRDPLLKNLVGDPRWSAFLREVGLADDQLK